MIQKDLFSQNAYGAEPPKQTGPRDGTTFDAALDTERLNAQSRRVYELMRDGVWRTLGEISVATKDPEASISARLRDLRKPQFGGFRIERRRRGEGKQGLHEYRMLEPGKEKT